MELVELRGGDLLVVKNQVAEVATVGKVMVAMVSTDEVDTDGDIIHQGRTKKGAGWLLDDFNANPILTWQHDRGTPNIGSAEVRAKVGKRDNGGRALYLDPFAFDMPDPVAAAIAGKYERGVLKQTSVGFIGKVYDKIMDGERMTGREFHEQKLIEVACVNVGANQGTETMIKRMLVRGNVTPLIEAAGDSAVEELKAELGYLRDELRAVSNAVKVLGDREPAGSDARVVAAQQTNLMEEAVKVMACDLLKRLEKLGVAQ